MLLQRVSAVEIMTCPSCRGAMRLVKLANKPDDIA
jgi:Zn-finger nucleic acid-binding protein